MNSNSLTGHSSSDIHRVFSHMKKSLSRQKIQPCDGAVITPIAQTVKPCAGSLEPGTILHLVETAFSKFSLTDPALFTILDLQFNYGLRISEVLSIKLSDISNRGFIKVRGKKGSSDRIIIPVLSAKYIQVCKERSKQPFQGIDRYYVYRQYNKLGLKIYFKDNSKYAVTHMFRYLNSKHLLQEFGDIDVTQKFLGHKQQSNTKIYVNKK